MKFILSLLLLFVAAPIYAGSTGLYFDSERDGEGLLVLRDDRLIITYFFSYGASSCDEDYPEPVVGPFLPEYYDCEYQGQRWFFTSNKWNGEDQEATGFMFMADGVNYPKGIPDVTDPFVQIVGEAVPVGVYLLRPAGDGYQMLVVPYGDRLDKDDPLFGRIYQFTTLLFEPLGVAPR